VRPLLGASWIARVAQVDDADSLAGPEDDFERFLGAHVNQPVVKFLQRLLGYVIDERPAAREIVRWT
jgi:hypothetical protein